MYNHSQISYKYSSNLTLLLFCLEDCNGFFYDKRSMLVPLLHEIDIYIIYPDICMHGLIYTNQNYKGYVHN